MLIYQKKVHDQINLIINKIEPNKKEFTNLVDEIIEKEKQLTSSYNIGEFANNNDSSSSDDYNSGNKLAFDELRE